jgi:hypothetical protein
LVPVDIGSIHLKISSLAPIALAKLFQNINTNKLKELDFSLYSEEQSTSDASV